jgi:hypothetical protein
LKILPQKYAVFIHFAITAKSCPHFQPTKRVTSLLKEHTQFASLSARAALGSYSSPEKVSSGVGNK